MKKSYLLNIGMLFWVSSLLNIESQAQTSTLSLEKIMQGESFFGFSPFNARWNSSGDRLYFQRNDSLGIAHWEYWQAGDTTFQAADNSAVNNELFEEEGVWNANGTKQIVSKGGKLKLYDAKNSTVRVLWIGEQNRMHPYFVKGDSALVYRSGNNLYFQCLTQGMQRQLTRIQSNSKPKEFGNKNFYTRQAEEIFAFVQRESKVDSLQKFTNLPTYVDSLPTFYLEGKTIRALKSSTNLQSFVLIASDEKKGKPTEMPSYVNVTGFTEMRPTRPKVGEEQSADEVYIAHEIAEFRRLTFDDLPGIWDTPEYKKEYPDPKNRLPAPKPCRIQGPFFHPVQNLFLLVLRSVDNKDRWIVSVNGENMQWQLIDHQRDEAWIGGPGIGSWNASAGVVGWVSEGFEMYYQSEAEGYSHLYTFNVQTGDKRQVTKGNWEVLDLKFDRSRENYCVFANRENPFEQYWYTFDWERGLGSRLGTCLGKSEWIFHSNNDYRVELASSANHPPELYIADSEGSLLIQTRSTTSAFEAYPWRDPEIIHFSASDGAKVPARLYRPETGEGGPAVIFVHGAGYLQNVHRWWSSYFREYFFHNLLADLGFTVLDIDYRGSAGYGRDWRTAIYRHMGGKDLQDQVEGAHYMVEELGVDPNRIGIYGGSYGGFITLMAMFQHPEIFKAGAALRSVTDWAHYNHPYTANILNTPEEDSIAYRRSSPIYYAENLKGHLLMLHGMEDDNVHFQDIVRLSQVLIEKEKENWELAIYPIEPHGFRIASSWLDEYRRILKLFVTHLCP